MEVINKPTQSRFPLHLDDNVIRSVASVTFFLAILMLFEPTTRLVVIPLFFDFMLRWIHPKYSPLARINKWINVSLLDNKPRPVFAPPKRFAMLIGLILTGIMSISYFFQSSIVFMVLLVFLIIASGLQSWFDYCLGCEIYDLSIKFGFLERGNSISDFSNFIEEFSTGSGSMSQSFKEQVREKGLQDGVITEEESQLINSIVLDLHEYDKLLQEAVSDGQITQKEKRVLWHDRNIIVRKAIKAANSDGNISGGEEVLLVILCDLLKKTNFRTK